MTEFLETCYAAIRMQEKSIARAIAAATDTSISVIEDKKQIVLIGCGDSYAAADYGRWAFLSIGLNVQSVSPDETRYLRIDQDTVVIGITASGRSLATIDALQRAKSQSATIVVLTDNAEGAASQEADHVWVTNSGVETYNTSPSAPTTAAMAYLLEISSKVGSDDKTIDDIQKLKNVGREMMTWAEEEGRRISKVTSPNVPIYLISDGPNHVAAQIGMMKFDEFSILKGIAAVREEFCHHYNISVNDGECAVLISNSPKSPSDDTFIDVLRGPLKMSAYHLFTDETLDLELPLVQTIPNTIALQMASYFTVLRYNPGKEAFKLPHAEAFKIY